MAAKLETVNLLPTRFRIASIIRKAILAGEYKEGETLSLTQTAEQLGVSAHLCVRHFRCSHLKVLLNCA